jgi:hypothetical protein
MIGAARREPDRFLRSSPLKQNRSGIPIGSMHRRSWRIAAVFDFQLMSGTSSASGSRSANLLWWVRRPLSPTRTALRQQDEKDVYMSEWRYLRAHPGARLFATMPLRPSSAN